MFCSKCGTQLPDDAMFCGECGAPTRNYRQQQAANAWQETPVQQPYAEQPDYGWNGQASAMPDDNTAAVKSKFSGGSKRGILMAAGILVIAVLAGLLYVKVLKPGTPQDTVHRLEKAMEDLDVEEMIACFDEETRQAYEDGMSEYGDMADGMTGLLGMAGGLGIGPEVTITVTDVDYDGEDACTVSADIALSFMGESQEDSMDLPMKKEGKKWVIDGTASDAVMGEIF